MARRTGRVGVLATAAAVSILSLPTTAAASPAVRGIDTLNRIVEVLNRHGGPSGTAWGVSSTGEVILLVETGAAKAPTDRLLRYAARFGSAVRVMRMPGGPASPNGSITPDEGARPAANIAVTTLRAGDGIVASGLGGSVLCSAGFPVITSNPLPPPPYAPNRVLTSGQCSSTFPGWSVGTATGPFLGSTAVAAFPRTDYGVIAKSASVPAISAVNLYNGTTRQIRSSGDPFMNRPVCFAGVGSGYRCGKIVGTNMTVNYGSGGISAVVYGLAAMNLCTKNTDRGGPVIDGTTAVGLVSRPGVCVISPFSYIQPVIPAMSANGLFFPPAS